MDLDVPSRLRTAIAHHLRQQELNVHESAERLVVIIGGHELGIPCSVYSRQERPEMVIVATSSAFQLAHIERSHDVDARLEELLDILPALDMESSGGVGVGKVVHQCDLGVPGCDRVHVDLRSIGACPVRRHHLEVGDRLHASALSHGRPTALYVLGPHRVELLLPGAGLALLGSVGRCRTF